MSATARPPLEIGDRTVLPGTREHLKLPVARLTTGSLLSVPLEVVHGRKPGRAVWLSGAIHGDELDGVEIIRRVLDRLRPETLDGTVVAAPIVNVYGFESGSRYLPDRRDLNRSFPGGKKGSMASRIAHLFMTEVVESCDYGVDFHCGSDQRENLPQVRADLEDEEILRLALAFGAPVVLHNSPPDGSLRKAALEAGARVILYEAGEAGRFTP
ncbi:MAG: succinylglutamate desuccinylase/aspartoacylase family protein, partial [Longimicrobiales bacterium]